MRAGREVRDGRHGGSRLPARTSPAGGEVDGALTALQATDLRAVGAARDVCDWLAGRLVAAKKNAPACTVFAIPAALWPRLPEIRAPLTALGVTHAVDIGPTGGTRVLTIMGRSWSNKSAQRKAGT